ncbi:MAG: hypothetical protein U1F55_09265 [Chitinivorax sp.]
MNWLLSILRVGDSEVVALIIKLNGQLLFLVLTGMYWIFISYMRGVAMSNNKLAVLSEKEIGQVSGGYYPILIGFGVAAWCSRVDYSYSNGSFNNFSYTWNCRW